MGKYFREIQVPRFKRFPDSRGPDSRGFTVIYNNQAFVKLNTVSKTNSETCNFCSKISFCARPHDD